MSAPERFLKSGHPMVIKPGEDCLRKEGGRWTIFGEDIQSYLNDFARVDEDDILPGFMDDLATKETPVIIDLLAPTDTLVSFSKRFRAGKRIKALAVGYEDVRGKLTTVIDNARGIQFLSSDISDFRNFHKISDWLGSDKADLVLERGYGGLSHLPTNIRYQYRAIQNIWNMLNSTGGIALLQLPPIGDLRFHDIPMEKWIDELNERGIYCKYLPSYASKDAGHEYGLLMLQRNSEAEQIPQFRNAKAIDPTHQARRSFLHFLDFPELSNLGIAE